MSETIQDGKYVELTYKVTDKKSGHVLTEVEFPLGYVHGHNEILAPFVHTALEGKSAGEVIKVPIDGHAIFTARSTQPADVRGAPLLHHLLHGKIEGQLQLLRYQRDGTRNLSHGDGFHGPAVQRDVTRNRPENAGGNA